MPELMTANTRPIPILVYHQIDAAPPKGAQFRSLYVSPAAFARQMQLLHWLGYQGLSMSGLEPYLRGEKTGKVAGITFDDGYLNNLLHALPVLQRHGFSSTCYAVSGLAGRTNQWDQAAGIAQVPLMDAGQMRQWVAGGQEIGSHTHNHVNLLECANDTCRNEIELGKSGLEAAIGGQVQHFCYPYGRYASKHAAMVAELGFVTATTTVRSRCHAGTSLLELPRVPILRSTSLALFWLKLSSAYEDRRSA